MQNTVKVQVVLVHSKHTQTKPRIKPRKDRTWFSHLLWHPVRKQIWCILSPQNRHGA